MTSREALDYIKNYGVWSFAAVHGWTKPDEKLIKSFSTIEKDITLVESLKNVLSKVTRVVYQPTWDIDYKIAENFDVEAFKDILDQLGYTLVKKEK